MNISSSYPLSPLQGGMLFHALYAPQSGVDIEQMIFRLDEPLDAPAFVQAWQRLVQRHALLRTAFAWEGRETPVQVVQENVSLPILEKDWRNTTAPERETRLEAFLQEDRRRGFSLSEAPLLRVALFDCGNTAVVVWTFHHAILDGRSFPLLLTELWAFYEALKRGEELTLPAPRPYRAFIDFLQNREDTGAEGYWREQLRGFRAPTPLGVDNMSDVSKEAGHDAQTATLSAAGTAALKRLTQENGLTLNTFLQGAWAILLSRYSGEEDIVWGATRACRHSTVEGAENTVGLFINTLPVRMHTPADAPFLPWLAELRAQHVSVRPFEQTPLSQVQGWSDVPRGESLFHSLVVFENYELNDVLRASGPQWTRRHFELREQTNFPLTLAAYGGDCLRLKLDYDRQKFSAATIARLLEHLQTILGAMAVNPDRTLGELPLLADEERRSLLEEISPKPQKFDAPRCLHEIFEERAAETPDAVALVFEETRMTYRDLNARANHLAHRLRRSGVGSETLVGLFAERSPEMIVGILGILKAGGAYLPIDVAYPVDRVSFMLADAKAPVLLTTQSLQESLPTTAAEVIFLDEDCAGESDKNPESGATADNLLYVIYTSGSTGKPKGALITHRNVGRLFAATEHWFGFGAEDVWTLFHSHAFDFSVWEIWGALLYGGRLVVVPYLVSRSPKDFHALLCSEGVTVLNQTPSAFRQLMSADEAADTAETLALRLVIFGGEALDIAGLKPWFARHGDQKPQLVNMYGITETTVHVTYRPLREADCDSASGSVIGVPIPDLQIHILDALKEPTPIGVPGEMFVGGAGLARGYLNRADLSAERFLVDPFSSEPDARLYKTGDLARRLPGGDIEYLGRGDQQVKIRGFRIELGEIESALSGVPGVTAATVLCREDAPSEKRLVAYLVLVPSASAPSDSEVRRLLQQKLPLYMIPAAFVYLPALPLTTNGKVDKKALPLPASPQSTVSVGEVGEGPRNTEEAQIARVWQDVLGVSRVGVHDNLFEMGAHSLLMVTAHSRLRASLGRDLPLVKLFQYPTISALAQYLRQEGEAVPAGDGQSRGARQREILARQKMMRRR